MSIGHEIAEMNCYYEKIEELYDAGNYEAALKYIEGYLNAYNERFELNFNPSYYHSRILKLEKKVKFRIGNPDYQEPSIKWLVSRMINGLTSLFKAK